jgi:alginate O-acetyltransferase complex protein AlgI
MSAMFGLANGSVALDIPRDVPFTLALGAFISLLPAMPFYSSLIAEYRKHKPLRTLTAAALVAAYVLAIARAVAVPFQPFIYFRF